MIKRENAGSPCGMDAVSGGSQITARMVLGRGQFDGLFAGHVFDRQFDHAQPCKLPFDLLSAALSLIRGILFREHFDVAPLLRVVLEHAGLSKDDCASEKGGVFFSCILKKRWKKTGICMKQ